MLAKRQEKSPVLNVRKNNSINAALKANATLHGEHSAKHLPKSATHSGVHQIASATAPASTQLHQQNYSSATPDNMSTVSSDDDSDHINVDKLKTIRSKAAAQRYVPHGHCIALEVLINFRYFFRRNRSHEHSHQNHSSNQSKDRVDANADIHPMPNPTEVSAIIIQKIWRGYNTRKQNKYIAESLQKSRTQEHIEYVNVILIPLERT